MTATRDGGAARPHLRRRRPADPAQSKARAWLFLLVVGARHARLAGAVLHQARHGQAAALRQQVRAAGRRRPARGLLGRGHRPRRCRRSLAPRWRVPEVRLVPDLCRNRRAVQLQRPRPPLLPARDARAGRRRRSTSCPRPTASAPATPSRSTSASGSPGSPCRAGTVDQGRRAAARPAGARNAARRDLRAGPRDPPRGRRQGRDGLPLACPFIVDVDNSYGAARPRGCASPSPPGRSRVLPGRASATSSTRCAILNGGDDRRLFPSRRRPPADPDPHRALRQGPHALDERCADHAGPGQCAARRPRRGRARRRRPRRGRARLLPDLPPQRPRRRDGDRRARRRLRGADLRHAGRARRARRARTGPACRSP